MNSARFTRLAPASNLVTFNWERPNKWASGRTFDYGGKIYVSAGDVLWSDRSEPMLTIVTDKVGKHDAGAAITLRAEMDLLIALSSCPASTCNAGAPIRPLAFEVFV